MWILQRLVLPLLRLGYQKVEKFSIPKSSISNTNVKVWVNAIPRHSIVITWCVHQQSNTLIIFLNMLILHYFHTKTYFLIVKMNPLAIPKSKTFTTTPCWLPTSIKGIFHYENNKNDNIWIHMANPPLEGLWDGQYCHISQQKIIVSHVMCEILCNIKKLAH